ncbi:amidase [Actinomadura syzygii]|uniref:Amidase n=2 Tax=Actinomadura syzygii TaxID=1427538 RepID=A0A5D0UKJ2_9ACTN|nr:amidase [Actinomadura syzygii]
MGMSEELAGTDAIGQAALVRAGEVTAAELTEAAIARIEAVDGRLNAVIHRRFDKARQEVADGLPDGPFHGVPILLKDLGCEMAGEPSHSGNRLLRDLGHRATEDAELTKSVRRAGFAILGRTNVPEFGLVNTTEPVAYGPARNPWDTGRSTGGSSGGSAAAVAAGLVPIAQASDGGGSIRMPASNCGLFGLKPSRGRISPAPGGDNMEGHTTLGFVSRTVRDTAAALDLAAGYRTGDSMVAPHRPESYLALTAADPEPLRIGLMDVPDVNGFPVDADVNAVVREAAGFLSGLGHRVEVSHPEAMTDPEFLDRWLQLLSPTVTALFEDLEALAGRPLERGDAEEMAWWWRERGTEIGAARHIANQDWRDRYRRRMASWWADGGFDVLLSPVLPTSATPLGYFDGEEGLRRSIRILCFTPQFNMVGQPAASVPFGFSRDGLPVGIHLAAAYGREDVLIRLAAQIERTRPWAQHRPAIFAD